MYCKIITTTRPFFLKHTGQLVVRNYKCVSVRSYKNKENLGNNEKNFAASFFFDCLQGIGILNYWNMELQPRLAIQLLFANSDLFYDPGLRAVFYRHNRFYDFLIFDTFIVQRASVQKAGRFAVDQLGPWTAKSIRRQKDKFKYFNVKTIGHFSK